MDLQYLKSKLDFESVVTRVRRFIYSPLGDSLCDEIEFMKDRDEIEAELDKVEEIRDLINNNGDLPIDGLSDIRGLISKVRIEGHYVSPEEFLMLLSFLIASRRLKKHVADSNSDSEERFGWAAGFCSSIYTDRILEHNISITIDESGAVKDSASATLSRIRKQINQHSDKLRKTLSSILKSVAEKELTQDDIVTQRDGRYVIPVKTENKRSVQGIIHGASASGQTVFVEPAEIIALNNELTELHFEEKREVEKILRELSSQVRSVSDELSANCIIMARMDFLQAKARYAIETISSKPKLTEDTVDLKNAFHPVLLQTHSRSEVIPLNFRLGGNFNTLVISGPNAGGKTVVLKTVGLCCLMLQSGFLIPAEPESEVKVFSSIFVSIGDEQSIENDLSTFSSHLRTVKEIIDESEKDSLVLIDEIASGTDPVLGSALSSAILKALSDRGTYSVVTTHNSELKEFAYSTPKLENASLEFDSSTLSPTFRFVTGIPGQSFTFEIAEKFSFPESIISEARSYLTENEGRLEDLLKELNETKQKYDEVRQRADIEGVRLKGLSNLYDEKLKDLAKNEKLLKQKAKAEAENIVREARRTVERTIKEVREEKKTPKQAKEAIEQQENLLKSVEDDSDQQEAGTEDYKEGDYVRLKGSSSAGEVMSISDKEVTVNINGFAVRLSPGELELLKGRPKEKRTYEQGTEPVESRISQSLDIRGKYTYEVREMIDKFLYDSVNTGLHEVSIIHGKGSGKLREEVRKQLKALPFVKSFRAGQWNEGDAGVTVVEL